MDFKFSLDRSRPTKLFICPSCGHRTFKRYIDVENNSYLDNSVGRCNRELNCGYHHSPRQWFASNPAHSDVGGRWANKNERALCRSEAQPSDYLSWELVHKTLSCYEHNHFFMFLVSKFGLDSAERAAARFYLGTSKNWRGAAVFWQIDTNNRVRTGKIMLYNSTSGKRVKEPFNHITWVHTLVHDKDNYVLRQCFFGEHQLRYIPKQHPIGIVESEKTAIIASIIMPELVWLSCGSINNLTKGKFYALGDRQIILYPDLNAFVKWKERADELRAYGLEVHVSSLLERAAHPDERAGGHDIADYLV